VWLEAVSPILRAAIGISLSLAGYLCSTPSFAQQPEAHCGPLAGILDYLNKRFNEFRIFAGVVVNGQTFVLTRAQDGSWSLIKTEGDAACLIAGGQDSEVDRGL
jgi:hypothetical protein